MSLPIQFRQYIYGEELVRQDDRILLAVSGGIDSMVMAHLCWKEGLDIGIAHCNFQLRGNDSDADESFLREWANKIHIPFYSIRFETERLASEQKKSIQLLARELRYDWLESMRGKESYFKIATAHHLNDSLETFIYNFTKGSGMAGLRGIPARNGYLIRPLLFAKKLQLLEYAKQVDLPFREDVSNASDKYSRNKIRHHVIPRLKAINPGLEETAARNFSILHESYLLYQDSVERFKQEWVEHKGLQVFISIEGLQKHPNTQQTLLFECLRGKGFHYNQLEQIVLRMQARGVGGLYYSQSHRLLIDRAFLIVEPWQKLADNLGNIQVSKETHMITLSNGMLIFEAKTGKPTSFASPDRSAYLDADRIVYPLQLRKWKAGDVFCPLGMNGHRQKIQDFFTNNGFSRYEKEETWLLLDANDNILWVVGHRLDERNKIVNATSSFLEITYLKDIL